MGDQIEEGWSDADESLLVKCDFDVNEAKDLSNISTRVTGPKSDGKANTIVKYEQTNDPEKFNLTGMMTPLDRFSKHDYLCVTDLTNQVWCEQQMCYTMMGIEPQALSPSDLPLPLPVADRPEVKAGKSVHLARELEVHDIVNIKITSKADKWALHVLNLLTTMQGFLEGVLVAREVPIFGDPFGTGDLFFGIIDELRFDEEKYAVSLMELKTRKSKRMPGRAQERQHFFQVHLYKQLWDNLVKGKFSIDLFIQKMVTKPAATQSLGKEVMRQLDSSAITAFNLTDLLSLLVTSAQALVCISSVEIEYILQDTGETIGRVEVEEDVAQLQSVFQRCMDFWHGQREVEGVDIEDVWKCSNCEFNSMCEWRMKKANMA